MAFTIKWLGQGGFLLSDGDKTVAIDPYLSDDIYVRTGRNARQRPVPVEPEALNADMIVATHDHDDHLDPATIARIVAREAADGAHQTVFAGPDTCLAHYRQLGAVSCAALNRGDALRVGRMRLLGVKANHTEDSIGLVVQCDGLNVYFTGDSLYSEDLADVKALKIDILYVCINGRLGNMNVEEAARLARECCCRAAVPDHYDMFAENAADPEDFARALAGDPVRVVLPVFDAATPAWEVLG